MKKFISYLVGGAFGIMIAIAFYFFVQSKHSSENDKNYSNIFHKSNIHIDTLQSGNLKIEVKQDNEIKVNEEKAILEEKIKSLNDRLGDIYLSVGMVITLLLGIIASVYFKTESEVSKHMQKYYGKYKDEILQMYTEAQTLLIRIRTNAELSETLIPKQDATMPIEGANEQPKDNL